MKKYRKRPITVEAIQWGVKVGNRWRPGRDVDGIKDVGCIDCYPSICQNGVHADFYLPHHGEIETLEGVMVVNPGDYVVTGPFGERYPVKREIFEATYYEVDK